MICKISCSIGELIDKISILKIKLKKAENDNVRNNITKELELLTNENPISNIDDILFTELYKINSQLWVLEDLIRLKSENKEFDDKYIELAENIHITNDKRYTVKKEINKKYGSELFEEKIYTNKKLLHESKMKGNIIVTDTDINLLTKGKNYYSNNDYINSYKIIEKLMTKYKNYEKFDSFFVDLLFSYSNAISIFGYENVYFNKIESFMKTITKSKLDSNQIDFCKEIYTSVCLKNLKYNDCKEYLNYLNNISGPGVTLHNMSFFKENDVNKTLLIYDGGGFGDKFMFARFIPILCNKYKNNKIVFFIDEKVYWIFNKVFNNISNLKIIPYDKPFLIPKFDYHTNLLKLIHFLNYDYDTLPKPLLIDSILNSNISNNCKDIVSRLKISNKKVYAINWFGNSENKHEKNNRRMDLVNAIPLFKLDNVEWIVFSKNISNKEKKLLSKYGVLYYGDTIDNGRNAFEESVNIMKNVDAVISTDTSLVHISPSLNVKTFVLLTTGCEWRWTNNETTNWYPDSILIKQTEYGKWNDVIDKLITHL